MKTKDIMIANVAVCRPGDNLAAAVATMWEARCGVLPVLDARDAVSGMLTDRDVCIALGTRNARAADLRVSDVSLPRVFTCAPEDDVRSALDTMTSQNVRRLPVVDGDGRLIGILSIDDMLLHAERRPGKSGLSYAEVVEAAQTILRSRAKGHKHAPAELVAVGHTAG